MIVRREHAGDRAEVAAVTDAAFSGRLSGPPPVRGRQPEAILLEALRADSAAWIPALSLVVIASDATIAGHVVCTRAHVGDTPVVALGPISVRPDRQRQGVGSALMHAVVAAADGRDEPLVGLLGDPAYYERFGFQAGSGYGIAAPDPAWRRHFQVRPLAAYRPGIIGPFAYAEPFRRI